MSEKKSFLSCLLYGVIGTVVIVSSAYAVIYYSIPDATILHDIDCKKFEEASRRIFRLYLPENIKKYSGKSAEGSDTLIVAEFSLDRDAFEKFLDQNQFTIYTQEQEGKNKISSLRWNMFRGLKEFDIPLYKYSNEGAFIKKEAFLVSIYLFWYKQNDMYMCFFCGIKI